MSPSLVFIVLAFYAFIATANGIDTSNSDEGPYDEEIKCYNLPYGGFGFLSHVLTYYTMTLLCMGRRPLPPWSELEATEWNITLAIAKLIFTSVPCIYTMVKCSHSWQFETIAAMKFALALTSSLIGFCPSDYEDKAMWVLLYIPGAIAGTAGTISLAISGFNHSIMVISAVFGCLALACSLVSMIIACCACRYKDYNPCVKGALGGLTGFLAFIPYTVVFGALYSDWVLAIVGNNLVGYPFGDNKVVKVLWVLYWVGKRLNLFMM